MPPLTFLLIHSPVTGPRTWEGVAAELRARGHEAIVPDLRWGRPPYWLSYARIVEDSLQQHGAAASVVLVGHSAAGLLIPLVAERVPHDALERCIYVDASLPAAAGERLLDVVTKSFGIPADVVLAGRNDAGELPRWGESWPDEIWEAFIPDEEHRRAFRRELPVPTVALYDEEIPTPSEERCERPSYLLLSEAYRSLAELAGFRGWKVVELPGQHLHMMVDPVGVANHLTSLAEGGV